MATPIHCELLGALLIALHQEVLACMRKDTVAPMLCLALLCMTRACTKHISMAATICMGHETFMLVLNFLLTADVVVENFLQPQVSLPHSLAAEDSMPLSRNPAL